jgi:hypothetical protein
MATTDANGLVIWQTTDNVTPLQDTLNVMTAGISDVLTRLRGPATLSLYASGAFTWTRPANLIAIHVRMVGAGGAGGGAAITAAGQMSGGSGGGSGGYSEAWFDADSLPTTVAISVGAGGVAVAGAAGGTGGDTSFGPYLTAGGGLGGGAYAAGTGTANTGGGSGGPSGSTTGASGNTIRLPGQTGGRTWTTGAGGFAVIGDGGSTQLALGALGATWNANAPSAPTGGGGGAGAANNASQATARLGGNGGAGLLLIEHFYG